MSETTTDPAINAKIARLRELIATAARRKPSICRTQPHGFEYRSLAVEPWVTGTVQYELRLYAWRVRRALKHVAKNPGLPQAQL